MSLNVIDFLQAHNIEHVSEGHKHARPGWVQISCPFCIGNPGYHLGYNLEGGFFNCWRCGFKQGYQVVLALLDGNKSAAKRVLQDYAGRPIGRSRIRRAHSRTLALPHGLQPLTSRAKKYLATRRYDPDMLEAVWHLQSTANYGDLSYRIFIPVYLYGHVVTWQCRATNENDSLKYITQSADKEIESVRDIVYGLDQCVSKTCAIVEGVTDVWRLGPGAVAVFGIKYRPSQVALLTEHFDHFHILFDSDPQAKIQANQLGTELSVLGGKVKVWDMDEGDPGVMLQREADEFMQQIMKGRANAA